MPKIKVFCLFNYHNGDNIILFGSNETEYDSGSFAEIYIVKIERSDSTMLGTLVILGIFALLSNRSHLFQLPAPGLWPFG